MTHHFIFRGITLFAIGLIFCAINTTSALNNSATLPDNGTSKPPELLTKTGTENGLTITIRCPPILQAGCENLVELTVHNDSDKIVYYNTNVDAVSSFRLSVTFKKKEVDTTAYGTSIWPKQRPMFNHSSPGAVKPGADFKVIINITRYFDLSMNGDYQIVAKWMGYNSEINKSNSTEASPLDFKVEVKDVADKPAQEANK